MVGDENSGEILDLLGELTNIQSECSKKNKRREGDEEMELSLGLSMNGKFGVDKKLKRCCCSSSVALPHPHAPLSRTLSLPAEEEEWGRRKELQTMRRMEARKKRMEKLKRVPREKEENSGVDGNGGETGLLHLHHHEAAANGDDSKVQTSENGEVIVESSSQGSMGPLRSASSENQYSVLKLPSSVHHQPRSFTSHYAAGRKQNAGVSPSGGRSPNCTATASGGQRQLQNTMPYVTTKSTGPNGRRVEGFLYGYRKGESVRIMCVCHGEFFTPKEFVEHGGSDVEHPLRHIVVSPFPLL